MNKKQRYLNPLYACLGQNCVGAVILDYICALSIEGIKCCFEKFCDSSSRSGPHMEPIAGVDEACWG